MLNLTRRLPLLVALAALAVYFCTMGGGVTVNNLSLVSKLAGWDNLPMTGQPLLWLVTLPLKALPAAWVGLTVKLLAAVLAAAILGLLTRTVQLLPWDHPWDTAGRLAMVLPVSTAGAVCGLEFSFWQEATSTCGDLLDLLLLAATVWLLLEYDARQELRWLKAAMVVLGLGMAENWVMTLILPLIVLRMLWTNRIRIAAWVTRGRGIQWKFVLHLAGLWLAGFSIYAWLPMVNGLMPHSQLTLREAWLATLHDTRDVAKLLYYGFWRNHRLLAVAAVLYFFVPTLPLLVKLRDEGTQNKSGVDRLQVWIYRSLRMALLLACLWLAFDPTVGLRQMMQHQMGLPMSLLTFDYVNALGAAFLMGNLLLISQPVPARDRLYRSRSSFPWTRFAVPAAAAGIALVAVGLIGRNGPAIWHMNFNPVEEYGMLEVKSLPAGQGVVLCDFPEKLYVFQAALARQHLASDWLAVDTHKLPLAEYRAQLQRRQPAGWLTDQNRHELTPLETLRLLEQLAGTNRLFYLHPSYGYFFEVFYLQPTGAVYEMKLRGKDPLDVPHLTGAELDANEHFWTGVWEKDLAQLVPPPRHATGLAGKLAHYGLEPAPRGQDLLLAEWYSLLLDNWGVALQKEGRLAEANAHFGQAVELNTNNMSARISMACNTNLQTGLKMGLGDVGKVADQLGNIDRLNTIVSGCGPFDEPTVDYLLSTSFLEHGLMVQAAEQLDRVRTFTPGALLPELALAEVYNRLRLTDRSARSSTICGRRCGSCRRTASWT